MTIVNSEAVSADKTDKPDFPGVSNHEFLTGIFGSEPSDHRPFVCNFVGNPRTATNLDWAGTAWDGEATDISGEDQNWYFTGARFTPNAMGKYRRTREQFVSLHAVVLDDVGTKGLGREHLKLAPTWLLETSDGNCQAGYVLDEPITNRSDADALMEASVAAGFSDPAAKGASTRYSRLPSASNGKTTPAFRCVLREWNPELRYTRQQLIDGLGLDITPKKGKRASGSATTAGTPRPGPKSDVYTPRPMTNPVLAALKERGLHKSDLGDGRHDITCPWVHEHTGEVDSGTVYFEPNVTYEIGGFKCHHGHCDGRHIGELLELLSLTPRDASLRATISIVPGKLDQVIDAMECELGLSGRYYQRGGLIVTIATDPGTKETTIRPINAAELARTISRQVICEKFDARSGSMKPVDPPNAHVTALNSSTQYPHLPVLNGIARQAYLRPDGTLVTRPGYDAETGMFGDFDDGTYAIPEYPTRADAEKALAELIELISEFEFSEPHDRSAALAAIMTAVIRPILAAAPMFHISAHEPGSGKSYLGSIVAAFASPSLPTVLTLPGDDEEVRKLLLSMLLAAPAVITFDNLTRDIPPLRTLCSVLTEPSITGRILGVSKTATVGTRALFLSSGNNVGPVRDMARRCVTINLDPQCEKPAERTFKQNPGPLEQVQQDRPRFVSLVLTILRAWVVAGRPQTPCKALASYGGWSQWIRQSLLWLGEPDPATVVFATIANDPDRELLGRFLEAWAGIFGNRPTMIREVVKQAQSFGTSPYEDQFREAVREIADEKGTINRNRLGWWVKNHQGRLVDGRKFKKSSVKRNAEQWIVETVVSGLSVSSVAKSEDHETVGSIAPSDESGSPIMMMPRTPPPIAELTALPQPEVTTMH